MTDNKKARFAVIDTETNIRDEVMSIGAVISDFASLEPIGMKYYIITPECLTYGMYTAQLVHTRAPLTLKAERAAVMADMMNVFAEHDVGAVFAYNALFDLGHLPELSGYEWYDIMKLAAYRQYNRAIPPDADCFRTGRLKRNYGVEAITRMLSGDSSYCEVHNALCDAVDELAIMKLLGHGAQTYSCTRVNK